MPQRKGRGRSPALYVLSGCSVAAEVRDLAVGVPLIRGLLCVLVERGLVGVGVRNPAEDSTVLIHEVPVSFDVVREVLGVEQESLPSNGVTIPGEADRLTTSRNLDGLEATLEVDGVREPLLRLQRVGVRATNAVRGDDDVRFMPEAMLMLSSASSMSESVN